jgi:hypothetical protein
MKNTIKSLFIRILTVLMLITVFTVPSVKQADAATKGSSISNPVVMTAGKTYTKTWNSSTTNKDFYNKIVVPARGVVTFTINQPLDGNDNQGYYNIYIKNKNGTELLKLDTSTFKARALKNASYKIGLAKGTYYFDVVCHAGYYSTSARQSHTVNYNYKFTKTAGWEVEPNNTKKKATALTLGTAIKGVFVDECYTSGGVSDADYYKVSLTKGVSYRIALQGFAKLDATNWIGTVIDSAGNNVQSVSYKTNSLTSGKFRYWDFTAPKTGTFYVYFYNAGTSTSNAPVAYTLKVSKSPAKTWKKMNGNWYYFNGSNKLATGWQKVGKKWYYFDSYGIMQKSRWIYTGSKKSFVGPDGAMLTGWQKIMVSDDKYSWYYFGSDGYAHTGWLKLSGKWYYLTSSGQMVHSGYWYVNGTKYIFDKSGVCQNP